MADVIIRVAMQVKDTGEFRLIELLIEVLDTQDPSDAGKLTVSAGDDAAAWSGPAGTTVMTTDTLVEGVHFDLARTSWRDLGWKSVAVNLSDIAAMGCEPAYSVVTLGLHGDIPVDGLIEMYRGMVEASSRYGGVLAGGDVVRSTAFFVTVAMTGTAESGERPLLTRRAARPGDKVAVTGSLGSSAGGLKVLAEGPASDVEGAARLRAAHNRPEPRVREGALLRRHGVEAAIDISDGLIDDLGKLCKASGVGARVHADALPVDGALRAIFPQEWRDLALSGGEDYELLFVASPQVMARAMSALDVPAAVIGEIVTEAEGVAVLDGSGAPIAVDQGGWDHFR